MILVVGATGILGSEICRRLVAQGKPVRGMVRATSNPELVAELKGLGVELVEADLKQPQTLSAAVQGAEVVISPATSTRSRQDGDNIDTVDRQGQLDLVGACEAEGVGQFIFVSFPPMPDEFPLQSAKREVEARLRKGPMPFTVLQPVNFMEVWLSPFVGFDVAAGKIRLYGDGDRANYWIANGDVAEFVVQAVGNERALGKLLPAGGPDAMSQKEVAAVFEELTGRTFEYEHLPTEVMKGMLQDDDEMTRTAAGLMLNCAAGDYVDLSETLEILPVERTGIREFAKGLLAQMQA